VEAAGLLIAHNRKRFPKPIEPGNPRTGAVTVTGFETTAAAAERVAELLEHTEPTTTVVAARTTNLLRDVAVACAKRGVAFNAAHNVVATSGGARAALLAYLRLLTRPGEATEDDVHLAFRTPNRYLPDGGARGVAKLLGDRATFTEAVASLGVTGWRSHTMVDGAVLLDELCKVADAGEIIHDLRSRGGLDRFYSDREVVSAQDESDIDVLVTAEREAAGMTPDCYVAQLEEEDRLLERSRDERGVELTTIHGAKGREWDTVFLFGADEGQLPHIHNSDAPDSTVDAVDVEEERRLMYVAMTRSKNHLHILHTRDQASRFITEAGLGSADRLLA
jgi:DNA helicase-2/ATP-dependent DNA helicase PcrA